MAVTILPFVQQILTQYIMSIGLAVGLAGNICCCVVFAKQSHPRTPSSIYFFALSIFANMYLLWSVPPLLYTLNHVDPQTQSVVYCKLRLYGSHVFGLFARYLIVFGCIDLYFMTNASVRMRSWSSVKIAYKLVLIMCIVGIIIGLHLPIFMDIHGNICGMFGFYKFFYPIYQFISIGVLPPILMGVFGFLAVHSVRQRQATTTHVKRRDRDLMRMLIAEIMIHITSSIPFSAYLLYGTATFYVVNKSTQRVEIESFLNFLTQLIIQLIFISPFYLFVISSKSFRRDFMKIVETWWYKYVLRGQVRIVPINGQLPSQQHGGESLK